MDKLSEAKARFAGVLERHPQWRTWSLACGLAMVLFALCVGALVQAGGLYQESAGTGAEGAASAGTLSEGDGASGGSAGTGATAGGMVGGAVMGGEASAAPGESDAGGAAGSEGAPASETASQANAFMSAKLHMSEMPYSYASLVSVLEGEGCSHEDAVYAADKLGVDWNAVAAEMAAQYLDTMEFTHEDLVDQLIYEGFSREQAEAGVTAAGL